MNRNPRIDELLAMRALSGLRDVESKELRMAGGEADESFDRAAAALDLAFAGREPLSPALTEKIARDALSALQPVSPVTRPSGARRPATWPAWLAAAAGLAIGVGALGWARTRPPVVVRIATPAPLPTASVPAPVQTPTPSELRARLLAEAADVQRVAWKATPDPAARAAAGDVVWSSAAQTGYMRFTGLAANDRERQQYQLWIFDKGRDAKYPVDGGVFDATADGELVIPIVAKLHVESPTLFAVTVERPGGVVVSKRERIVLTASSGAG